MGGMIDRLRFALDHRWAPDRMSEYLDADLDPSDRDRLERHVGDCPQCEELLRELRVVLAGLGRIRGEAARGVAAAVLAGVHERLAEEEGEGRHG
jgi:anti-sigma factor RsiW